MTFRIAVGGIHTECSTGNPALMEMEHFRVVSGSGLIESDYFGFLKNAENVAIAPLLHARAVPGGPVSAQAYQAFKADFLMRLQQSLPIDGLYLAMHGAMNVEGMDDAEADWISAARAVIGPDCPLAVSYDLHGNVSQTIIDQIDIFAAYRTAPHIDVRETMTRAYTMLVKSLETGIRPGVAWARVPVLLPGERTSTEDEPAASLYRQLADYDAMDGIWDANLMIGYVWADEPRATACAVVTASDHGAAAKAAAAIALSYWNARNDFAFGPVTGPLEDMLDLAEKARTRPVILADSGDNPTGGGVGDRADVLKALVERDFDGALIAGIADRAAVEACFASGTGARMALSIGGRLDPKSPSITLAVDVLQLDDPGDADERQAVVATGGITVVLSARRRPYHNIADFTRFGFDPETWRLLVVKSGYLSPELAPIARPNLMALTDGAINQDIEALPNARRIKPTYPFEKGFDFAPQVRCSARWAAADGEDC
ncbi:M81 family metallopeptidase [Martelella sp. HB161492]|uniref:M81 family metallopeptidase n=1 Tax=Martelella sp. HB161492 TaxID=2720726 RepID=UPI00159137F7|nr:M81 family metallopeptidase [Martelella sp. HB161492]